MVEVIGTRVKFFAFLSARSCVRMGWGLSTAGVRWQGTLLLMINQSMLSLDSIITHYNLKGTFTVYFLLKFFIINSVNFDNASHLKGIISSKNKARAMNNREILVLRVV